MTAPERGRIAHRDEIGRMTRRFAVAIIAAYSGHPTAAVEDGGAAQHAALRDAIYYASPIAGGSESALALVYAARLVLAA